MNKQYIIISIQVLLALAYAISPLPKLPFLSFDVLIILFVYWVLHRERSIYLGAAWGLGLLKDVLSGALLGEHGFALTLVTYLLMKLAKRMRFFAIWQQALSVGALVLVNQLTIALLESLQGHFSSLTILFYPPMVSAIFWLLIHVFFGQEDELYLAQFKRMTRTRRGV